MMVPSGGFRQLVNDAKSKNEKPDTFIANLKRSFHEKDLKYRLLNDCLMLPKKLDARAMVSILQNVTPLTAQDGLKHITDTRFARWVIPRSEFRKSEETYQYLLRERCKQAYERQLFPEQKKK